MGEKKFERIRMALARKFCVEHITKEGARYHVHSYGLIENWRGEHGTLWCSEAFCEDNLHSLMTCIENGFDPIKIIPSMNAKEWLKSPEGQSALNLVSP